MTRGAPPRDNDLTAPGSPGVIGTRLIAISLTTLILAAGCLTAAAQAPPPPPAEAFFELPGDPDGVVVRYQQVIGKLEDRDPGPSLTIYASGRILVHYPRYMKRAGDWETFLGRHQVEEIVASLVEKDVPEVNAEEVVAEVAAAGATKRWTSDSSTTVIELHLDEYRPAGARNEEPKGLRKEIRWENLGWQAAQHPGVSSLQKLAEAERELRSLMTHEDLERLDD